MALAIDIETLGMLHVEPLPPITCICMYNHSSKTEYRLRFWKLQELDFQKNKQTVLTALDNATCIIGYNVVFFDLEFIKKSFPMDVDAKRFSAWIKKTIDMFMCLKYIFKNTCKLDTLLSLNNLSLKIGSGNNAILLAEEEKWDQLLNYCMSDTMLTFKLFSDITKESQFKNAHICEISASQTMKLKWFNVHKSHSPRFISVYFRLDSNYNNQILEHTTTTMDYLLVLPSLCKEELCFETDQ